ncbi:MAG: hypothetical protein HS111_01265 [Kofleriaceae bacterium]|nr:hypothetical protein [Kofleriaceae bacterium]MCL4226988.1 hypothetical protein [Myxococcales bacterium]
MWAIAAALLLSPGCGAVEQELVAQVDAAADAPAPEVDAAADAPAPEVDAPVADAAIDAPASDAPAIDAAPVPHLVFVTSTTTTGALGGLAGADARCQTLAASVGLGGTYRAILADEHQSVFQRIAIGGPVRNLQGTVLAADAATFFAGTDLLPNSVTERGEQLTEPTVAWIGGGTLSCAGWTSDSASVSGGLTFVTANQWSRLTANTSCIASVRLQCISQ